MPETPAGRKPPADRVQTVIVRRIIPMGLIVSLPDGREGLIRERELAWDAVARRGWRERYSPNYIVQVVPLGRCTGSREEYSLRLAQLDPWLDMAERYPAGGLVDGIVTGIMPYGIFVELEPGITGLVHTSRFPAAEKRTPGEIFWPGDVVKVIVQSSDPVRRRMSLSIAGLAGLRWHAQPITEPPIPSTPTQDASQRRPSLDTLLGRPPKMVRVIEDDLEQRKAVSDWLRFAGQRTDEAASGEDGLVAIDEVQPDLVLIDVGLPAMTGIDTARHIRRQWPAIRCVLMTDWSRAEQYTAELEALAADGVALLLKPLLPEDLIDVLLDTFPRGESLTSPISSARARLEHVPSASTEMPLRSLVDMLAKLRAGTRADKAVVFELDPLSRQVTLLAQHGPLRLQTAALPQLIHSPVRDVAEDGRTEQVADSSQIANPRYRHLIPLLNFGACLGTPVPVALVNRYALFLFYAQPTPVREAMLTRVEAGAANIALWLERQYFTTQVANLHRVAMLGQLTRALVHEVSGRITPINLALSELQVRCDTAERVMPTALEDAIAEVRRARQARQILEQRIGALAKITRSFSRLTRTSQEELIRLDSLVEEAVEILHDTAEHAHVTIVVQPAQRLYFSVTHVTFLMQVLVNVLQNAIQQIDQARPGQGGRVEIRLSQRTDADESVVQVSIEDDGPGIHRRLWERIFEADYTTRPDGSGLGLYISRSLIESQGGQIYVASSRVSWGSTFVAEVPYKI